MRTVGLKTCTALLISTVFAHAHAQNKEPFLDFNLQEVLELEITSVSKKPQTVSRAAAAVHVITGDDIRRFGAQNIADALRLAPGMQVAQVSSNAWAVSARGPNGRFANKLLVLIDGRTVYTPMFSGVFWDTQNTVMADIERIEVIRGPGAALWGANAVNGVVNIITKSAAATQGTLIDFSAGTESSGNLSMRYGGEFQGLGHWRLYGKAFENKAYDLADGLGKGFDSWRQQRVGWRADVNPTPQDAVTFQAEVYEGRYGESSLLNFELPPGNKLQGITQSDSGGHVLARWQRDLPRNNSITTQAYFDQSRRDWPAHTYIGLNTFDADVQYRHRSIEDHDVVVGASFRQTEDQARISTTGLPAGVVHYETFDTERLRTRMWSLMAQDDITLSPDRWILTLGSKFEKYEGQSIKPLPNVRLMWTPDESTTFWSSASKAIRTPSRVDRNGTIRALLPAEYRAADGQLLPRPAFIDVAGNAASEELWAYELGWKQKFNHGLSLDASVYYNKYSKLRSGAYDLTDVRCLPSYGTPIPVGAPPFAECYSPVPLPNQYLLLPAVMSNDIKGHSQGLELSLDWQPSRQQRWQVNMTRFDMTLQAQSDNAAYGDSPDSTPKWSGSVRWSYTPNARVETDVIVRYAGALPNILFNQSVPSYTATDVRFAWNSSPQVQWSVTGRNLLTAGHLEFISEMSDVADTLISPSIAFGLRVQY
jgi:iron complex outermembrane recepter protein